MAFITSVTCSAPAFPSPASFSDIAVNPEMSTKAIVPSSSRHSAVGIAREPLDDEPWHVRRQVGMARFGCSHRSHRLILPLLTREEKGAQSAPYQEWERKLWPEGAWGEAYG